MAGEAVQKDLKKLIRYHALSENTLYMKRSFSKMTAWYLTLKLNCLWGERVVSEENSV